MITGKPTPKQEKDWLNRITMYAEDHGEFPKQEFEQFDRHHVKGREYKHNKIHIGRWFVLPIAKRFHDIHSNNPWNVSHYPKRYTIEFGNQRDQFTAMCMVIKNEDGELPFGDEVLHAIMNTRY